MHYGRRQQATYAALDAVTAFAQTHPLLCLTLPHRWFPISKTLSVCVRCRGVSETQKAPRFTPRAVVQWVTR